IYDENLRTEAMAKLIDSVMRGDVLHVSPVLVSQESFEQAEVKLTFTNASEVPMRAQGTLPPQGALHVVPDSFDMSVPPGKDATVAINLRADQATGVKSLSPMSVNWTATYLPPGRNPVRVPREEPLVVERISECPARTTPVVVDGNLDEWTSFPFSMQSQSAQDCSCRSAVEHDEKFVYVAVKTTDDR